jgi:hypothetical protein
LTDGSKECTPVNLAVPEHGGRIVKTTGDGVLIEFGSVVGAVQCAIALQRLTTERNAGIASDRRMEWRIGVHLGDVLIQGDDIAWRAIPLMDPEDPAGFLGQCRLGGHGDEQGRRQCERSQISHHLRPPPVHCRAAHCLGSHAY